jgi:predicted ATPase/class 3 adenylate cyclase
LHHWGVGRDLPTGTVTFVFTDIEGSTRRLDELGPDRYAAELVEHRRAIREAFAGHGGVEVYTQGDAFFYAFTGAPGALRAAKAATESLASGPTRVRIGVHTGTAQLAEGDYVGMDVHRAARIAAAGHGGQVLVSEATVVLVGPAGLKDLGDHRLKDLSSPVRIYQLGDAEFPALKTLYQTNLPVPATPFLGREQELADVEDLLGHQGLRLLTLTGPGGMGKTRLAVQAAATLSDRYPDGVYWVPLAPLREPALVLEAGAQALGAKDGLAEEVADKRLLLLFDNFEHLSAAATDIASLLASCPNLQLLVTSRELLGIPGEHAYPVPQLRPEDGTELFVTRARAAKHDFEPDAAVADLCARLEHLPLALELAAARVRVLSPAQLLERLSQRLDLLKGGRGTDARQQTLRTTIEWSHELLDEEERRLFARLSVFVGGCTLEAAEAVCDADVDTLQSLVDKSLVRVRDQGRFWMLETIREYAAERLDASGDAGDLRRRHAEYFLKFREDAGATWGIESGSATELLEREHDNLRAAIDYFEAEGETQPVLELVGGLANFWLLRGYVAEGRRRLEAALAADKQPTVARAWALDQASTCAVVSGDPSAGRKHAEEALALYRELGDEWGIADSLWAVAYARGEEGDPAGAQPFLEESVGRFRELGDENSVVSVSRALGFSYHELGQLERARELHEENLARARELGFEQMEARSLASLASVLADEGRVTEAAAALEQAYRMDCDLGNRLEIAIDVGRFARVLAVAGQDRDAARLLSCSAVLLEELNAQLPWVRRMNEQTEERIRARLSEAELDSAGEEGGVLTADEAVELALAALG